MTTDDLPQNPGELRVRLGDAPEPKGADRLLVLPSAEWIEANRPDSTRALTLRRGALWKEFLNLQSSYPDIHGAEFCRHQLLDRLFGAGETTVGDCWQSIFAMRGAEMLPHYNSAVSKLIATGSIDVRTEQSTDDTPA